MVRLVPPHEPTLDLSATSMLTRFSWVKEKAKVAKAASKENDQAEKERADKGTHTAQTAGRWSADDAARLITLSANATKLPFTAALAPFTDPAFTPFLQPRLKRRRWRPGRMTDLSQESLHTPAASSCCQKRQRQRTRTQLLNQALHLGLQTPHRQLSWSPPRQEQEHHGQLQQTTDLSGQPCRCRPGCYHHP
jgi:hypothetical protein